MSVDAFKTSCLGGGGGVGVWCGFLWFGSGFFELGALNPLDPITQNPMSSHPKPQG